MRRQHGWQRWGPVAVMAPSALAILVFVYGFIGWTGYVSLSHWNTFIPDYRFEGFRHYLDQFHDLRFQSDLRNTLFFTVLFIAACLLVGLGLAVLVEQRLKGSQVFRNIYLFPMALSFVVTGVVWQWLLNPRSGVNLLLAHLGIKDLPLWYISTRVIPGIKLGQIKFGLPVALIAIVFAAVWQMSGFAMAIYLAGLQGIPQELREAAAVDGAGGWQTFRRIILPLLRPITISIVVLLAHVSLKTFDLVFTMSGSGAGFVTDLPGINMFQTSFHGNHFADGAVIATVMLLVSAVLTVPYLLTAGRRDRLGTE